MPVQKIKKFVRNNRSAIVVGAITTSVIIWQHKCIVEAIELLEENNITIPK